MTEWIAGATTLEEAERRARRVAEALGHEMEPVWRMKEPLGLWQLYCLRCGKLLQIVRAVDGLYRWFGVVLRSECRRKG